MSFFAGERGVLISIARVEGSVLAGKETETVFIDIT